MIREPVFQKQTTRILIRRCVYCGKVERLSLPAHIVPCPSCYLYGSCNECAFLGRVVGEEDLYFRGLEAAKADGHAGNCPRKLRRKCFFHTGFRSDADIEKYLTAVQ